MREHLQRALKISKAHPDWSPVIRRYWRLALIVAVNRISWHFVPDGFAELWEPVIWTFGFAGLLTAYLFEADWLSLEDFQDGSDSHEKL